MDQEFKAIAVERQIDKNNRKTNKQRVEIISYVDPLNGSFLMLIQVFSEKLLSTNYADVIFSEMFIAESTGPQRLLKFTKDGHRKISELHSRHILFQSAESRYVIFLIHFVTQNYITVVKRGTCKIGTWN